MSPRTKRTDFANLNSCTRILTCRRTPNGIMLPEGTRASGALRPDDPGGQGGLEVCEIEDLFHFLGMTLLQLPQPVLHNPARVRLARAGPTPAKVQNQVRTP